MFLFRGRGLFCQVIMTFLLCHYDLSTRSFRLVTWGGGGFCQVTMTFLAGHYDLPARLFQQVSRVGEFFSAKSSNLVWWCMNIYLKKSVIWSDQSSNLSPGGWGWLKLGNQEPGHYLDGWPFGNTRCCRRKKGHFGRFAASWYFACGIQ